MEIKNTLPRTKGIQALMSIGLAFQFPGAVAADANEAPSGITVSGSATLTNDYIWRGLTQTFGKPALQVGVDMQHESGAYLGAWGATRARTSPRRSKTTHP